MKTTCDKMRFESAKVLSLNSYQRFLVNVKRSKQLLTSETREDNKIIQEVHDPRHPESTPRRFENDDSRCDCKDCIPFMEMCPHEICRK